MRKWVGLIVSVLGSSLLLAIPPANADQIIKVVDHPIIAPRLLSLAEIKNRVYLAATKRGWSVQEDGPQRFRASIQAGGGSTQAVVAITYTDKAYSIELVESKGLGQRGDQINGRANRWIRNLEQDIHQYMQIATQRVI
jgi:hypothetical protein